MPVALRIILPVVVKPTVEFTVPMDQLTALLVKLAEPVLPAKVPTALPEWFS